MSHEDEHVPRDDTAGCHPPKAVLIDYNPIYTTEGVGPHVDLTASECCKCKCSKPFAVEAVVVRDVVVLGVQRSVAPLV